MKKPNQGLDFGVQRCGVLVELPGYLRALNTEPGPILARWDLAEADLSDPDNALPYASVLGLLDECADATGVGHFGLALGLKAHLAHFGMIGELMRNAPSLGQAIRDFIGNHHRFVRGGAPYEIEHDPYLLRHKGEVLVGYRCMISALPTLQFSLATVGIGASLASEVSGRRPSQVHLGCSDGLLAADAVRAILKPSMVVFDSRHFGITYGRDVIDSPIPGADPARYRQAYTAIQGYWNGVGPDFVDQVRRLLLPAIFAEKAHMNVLSEALRLHPRTINRRLKEQGTSLRALVNETRYEIASQLLKHTDLPIASVAEALGYSEPSVFTRAFRQWSGQAPDNWRQTLIVQQSA